MSVYTFITWSQKAADDFVALHVKNHPTANIDTRSELVWLVPTTIEHGDPEHPEVITAKKEGEPELTEAFVVESDVMP